MVLNKSLFKSFLIGAYVKLCIPGHPGPFICTRFNLHLNKKYHVKYKCTWPGELQSMLTFPVFIPNLHQTVILKNKYNMELWIVNVSFNNISVIIHLWFLIAEETGVAGENDRAITSNWQTSWYKCLSSTPLYRQETIKMTDNYSYPELRGEPSMEHMCCLPTFTRCIMCIQEKLRMRNVYPPLNLTKNLCLVLGNSRNEW